ncbi:ribonuclease H-like domain-containing protein [Tanacetum coccineum]
MLNKGTEPKTYFKASQHKHWVDAMNAEMDALYKNNTWELADFLVGRKAIGSKWVFKITYKSNGEIERYKARLVAKGFNQRDGIDFDETFSHVVKIMTIRCLINLDVQSGWTVYQMDINNAFLYDDLNEPVYMTLPPDLGKLKYFMGIEVLETPNGICLSKRKYCLELIDEFGILASKPSYIPIQPNIYLSSESKDDDPLLENINDYQKLIGKLIYLTTTRTDIAYIVSCLSQFMHCPLKSHLKIALKIIRYLKSSPGKGINVIKQSASSIVLKAYSNADWERCTNTRRFVTG